MKNPLTSALQRFARLNPQEADLISKHCCLLRIRKGEHLLRANSKSLDVYFILSGVFRNYFVKESGDEVTRLFYLPGELMADLNNFYDGTLSSSSLQAETDGDLIRISNKSWKVLANSIPDWNIGMSKLFSQTLHAKMNFQRKVIEQDAIASYKDFLEEYPNVIQLVPASHVASFMGITRHSLSRVRGNFTALKRS